MQRFHRTKSKGEFIQMFLSLEKMKIYQSSKISNQL